MKKIYRILASLMVCLLILSGCDPGTRTSSGGTTTAPPVDTGPGTETTEAVISSEAPTTYESGESGNETTEYVETTESVVTTESSDIPTEGKTEVPTEPKPTEPKPTEPKPTEPKPTEPKPTEPKPTEPTPTNPPHTHSWSGWTQTKAPTCTEPGTETRTCSCGATETRPVNALGHTWQETAPTCTEAGSKTCKVCGKQESGASALGHDWVHHDEEGHWQDVLTCRCGAVFYSYEDWDAHFMSFPREEREPHGGYSGTGEWVVDKAAYDSCSRCGATR